MELVEMIKEEIIEDKKDREEYKVMMEVEEEKEEVEAVTIIEEEVIDKIGQ